MLAFMALNLRALIDGARLVSTKSFKNTVQKGKHKPLDMEEHRLRALLLALLEERSRRLQINVHDGDLVIRLDDFWISFVVGPICDLTLTHSDQQIPYLTPDSFIHLVPEECRSWLEPNHVHSVGIDMGRVHIGFSTNNPVWTLSLCTHDGTRMELPLDRGKVARLVESFATLRITLVFPNQDTLFVSHAR
jgi:hypothetical protein